jgi:hypothetical protein
LTDLETQLEALKKEFEIKESELTKAKDSIGDSEKTQ